RAGPRASRRGQPEGARGVWPRDRGVRRGVELVRPGGLGAAALGRGGGVARRPPRDGCRGGGARGPQTAGAPAAVLLRPAPRTVGARRRVGAAGRYDAARACVRGGRAAGRARRGTTVARGPGQGCDGPVLVGAVVRRLLRRLPSWPVDRHVARRLGRRRRAGRRRQRRLGRRRRFRQWGLRRRLWRGGGTAAGGAAAIFSRGPLCAAGEASLAMPLEAGAAWPPQPS